MFCCDRRGERGEERGGGEGERKKERERENVYGVCVCESACVRERGWGKRERVRDSILLNIPSVTKALQTNLSTQYLLAT